MTQEPETEMTDSSPSTGAGGTEPRRQTESRPAPGAGALPGQTEPKAPPAADSHARSVTLEGRRRVRMTGMYHKMEALWLRGRRGTGSEHFPRMV